MRLKQIKVRFVTSLLATAAVALAGAHALASTGPRSERPRRPAASGLTSTQLLGIADATARRCGDHHAYDIEAVHTTRGAAGQVIWPGAGVGSDPTPVYAITMRGKFTAYDASIPAGGHFPTGTVISIVVAATGRFRGQELDFNLTRRPEPDLGKLGRVIYLNATPVSTPPVPPRHLAARRLRPRPGAVARGTVVSSSDLFTERVFAAAGVGFALGNDGQAQYPALSIDGGRTWRIDGPQVHIDAADGAEGVGYVGIAGPHAFFAYGSSAVDATTNGGRTWWETFLGELVTAVVPGPRNELIAHVQQSVSTDNANPAVTSQYVSRDGGRHWSYSTALGG